MPIVFIHGVNVRDRSQNRYDARVMASMMFEHVIEPLAGQGVGRFGAVNPRLLVTHLASPFWGEFGVKFRWGRRTVPDVGVLDVMGGEPDNPMEPSRVQVEDLKGLLGSPPAGHGPAPQAEPAGSSDDLLLRAARNDLPGFLDVVLEPLIRSELRLAEPPPGSLVESIDEGDGTPDFARDAGLPQPYLEALLLVAADEVASDPEFQAMVREPGRLTSDEELLEEVRRRLDERFERLAATGSKGPAASTPGSSVQPMGGDSFWEALGTARERIGEFAIRAGNAVSRVPTVATLFFTRRHLTGLVATFAGDVFEYLHHRDERDRPGPIVRRVLDEIDWVVKKRPGEPLVVVTHSMGGNIFYDILTHYRPGLEVEVWLSVGGQVGFFEEMKLFRGSDERVASPSKIGNLGGRVRCWLNIYDPADPFAFLAEPVFADVRKDVRYSTGSGDVRSHTTYFKRRSFYDAVRTELEAAYRP